MPVCQPLVVRLTSHVGAVTVLRSVLPDLVDLCLELCDPLGCLLLALVQVGAELRRDLGVFPFVYVQDGLRGCEVCSECLQPVASVFLGLLQRCQGVQVGVGHHGVCPCGG